MKRDGFEGFALQEPLFFLGHPELDLLLPLPLPVGG